MVLWKPSGCVLMAVWLLAMTAASGAQQENSLQGPENTMSFNGTNATFKCVSPLRGCTNMTWYQGIIYDLNFTESIEWRRINYSIHPNIKDKFIVENATLGCKLTVTAVQYNDKGSFKCAFQNSSERTAELFVIHGSQREPLRGPYTRVGYVGFDATFTCVSPLKNCVGMNWSKDKVGGKLETIFNWRTGSYNRDKYNVTSSTEGCRLTVKRIELSDANSVISLSCQIVISQKTYEGGASLLVLSAEEEYPLQVPENSISFNGTNATFTCLSTLRNCDSMKWYQFSSNDWSQIHFDIHPNTTNKFIMENSTLGCKLTVTNVQVSDQKDFKCVFKDSAERTAGLYVIDGPLDNPLRGPDTKFGYVGTSVDFTCTSPLKNCVGMNWLRYIEGIRETIYNSRTGFYNRDKYNVTSSTEGCQLTVKRLELNYLGVNNLLCQIVISQTTYKGPSNLLVASLMQGPEKLLSFNGTNATFICAASLRNCDDMTWHQKVRDPISNTSWRRIDNNIHPNFTNKFIVENSTYGCKLTVTNVQFDDNGDFMCEYENSVQGTATLVVIDEIQGNPLRGPQNGFGFVGFDANFTCLSPLKSCVGMNWYKYKEGTGREIIYNSNTGRLNMEKYSVNFTLTNSKEGCQLIVKNLEINDAVSYICEVMISEETYEGTAILDVFDAGEKPLKGPKNSLAYVGTNATFNCVSALRSCSNMTWHKESPSARPPYVIWQRIDRYPSDTYSVENSPEGCNLIVRNIQRYDAARYKCRFMNYFEATAELFAISQDRIPLWGPGNGFGFVGSEVNFTCVSALRSCVGLNWYKYKEGTGRETILNSHTGSYNSDKYTVTSSTEGCQLIVEDLELSDAGSVICEIVISDRTYEGTASLLVFSTQQENILTGQKNSLVFVHSAARLYCTSPLKNCANITWQRGQGSSGISLDVDSYPRVTDQYTVRGFDSSCVLDFLALFNNSGPYTCRFMNSFEVTVELYVIDAPRESPLEGPEDCISYVGSDVTFTCVSPLRNCVEMTWYKSIEGTDRETIFREDKAIYLRDKYIVEASDTGCRLIVTNVEVNDTGSFICEIPISRTMFERTARLAVINDTPNESPLKGPGNFTVAVGSSVSFTCVSPLRDCAGISWNTYVQPSNPVTINIQDRVPRRPDKYIIEDSTEGCNLTVKNVEDKDQGGFFCRIFIGTTTIESTGYLTVTTTR